MEFLWGFWIIAVFNRTRCRTVCIVDVALWVTLWHSGVIYRTLVFVSLDKRCVCHFQTATVWLPPPLLIFSATLGSYLDLASTLTHSVSPGYLLQKDVTWKQRCDINYWKKSGHPLPILCWLVRHSSLFKVSTLFILGLAEAPTGTSSLARLHSVLVWVLREKGLFRSPAPIQGPWRKWAWKIGWSSHRSGDSPAKGPLTKTAMKGGVAGGFWQGCVGVCVWRGLYFWHNTLLASLNSSFHSFFLPYSPDVYFLLVFFSGPLWRSKPLWGIAGEEGRREEINVSYFFCFALPAKKYGAETVTLLQKTSVKNLSKISIIKPSFNDLKSFIKSL